MTRSANDYDGTVKPVLIVDDDQFFRALIMSLLEDNGIPAIEARSARDASQILQTIEPAMAIVDYRMPETDGFAWISSVRESGRRFPIVFLSGTWCDEKTFNLLRNILRVSLILRKPIEPDLFIQQIESLLPNSARLSRDQIANNRTSFASQVATNESDPIGSDSIAPSTVPESSARLNAEQEELLIEMRDKRARLKTQHKLHAIKGEYADQLKESWRLLSQQINQAQQEQDNAILISDATAIAHKLRGTAGSIGYHATGECAGKIEDLLRRLDPTDTLREIIWTEIFRELAQGEKSIEPESGDPGPQKDIEPIGRRKVLIVSEQELSELGAPGGVSIYRAHSTDAAVAYVQDNEIAAAIVDAEHAGDELMNCTARLRLAHPAEPLPLAILQRKSAPLSAGELLYAGATLSVPNSAGKYELTNVIKELMWMRDDLKPRVLVVDDDDVLCAFVASILSGAGMLVQTLSAPIRIQQVMEEFEPNLVLLDVIMPGLSGYDVCRFLREQARWQQIPVIFLTSRADPEGKAAAFKAGADDFLSKPVLGDELIARVSAQLDHYGLGGRRQQVDELTGIYTRSEFMKRAERLLSQAAVEGTPSIALLHVESFSDLSVMYSLFAAEEALTALGRLLHARFRAVDLRCRWSEDRFAILFKDAQPQTVADAMKMLLQEYCDLEFEMQEQKFHSSFSAGISSMPVDGENLQSLLNSANRRLKEAESGSLGAIAFQT